MAPTHARTTRLLTLVTAAALPLLGGTALLAASPATAGTVSTVNPLAAYADWNVVSFGNTSISAESEGPVATAGDLTFTGTNIAFKASTPIALLTGGKIDFAHSSGSVQVNSSGALRLGDLSNADVLNTDQNNAAVNTQIVAAGAGYGSTPAIASTHRQPVSSVSAPGLFASTFPQSNAVAASAQVAGAATATCNASNVITPTINGGRVSVAMHTGVNYWTVSAADLSTVSEITFAGPVTPDATDPLIINVTGSGSLNLSLTMAGSRDPHGILFNLPNVTTITQGGDSIDGSILAPNADYTKTSANLQGTAIVASATLGGSEEHFFPFAGFITTCDTSTPNDSSGPATTPTPTPTATATPAVNPTPTPAPTVKPTDPVKPAHPSGATSTTKPSATPVTTTAGSTGAAVETGGTLSPQSPWWWTLTITGMLLLLTAAATFIVIVRRRRKDADASI